MIRESLPDSHTVQIDMMTNVNDLQKICLIHGNQQLLVEETANSLVEERLEGRQYEWSLERFNAHEMLKTSGESDKNMSMTC